MVKPINRQTINPTITAAAPWGPIPAGELAKPKLWDMAAPTIMPTTKTAASPSPSPLRKSCRPGHPPARAKASPASVMRQSSKRGDCEQWADSGNPGGIAEEKIREKGKNQKRGKAAEQVRLAEKNQVPDRPHRTEATLLGQNTDNKSSGKGDPKRCRHGAGPFEAIEKNPAFRLPGDVRIQKNESQETQHDDRHHKTDGGIGGLGTAEIVSPFQEQRPDPDACRQAGKTEDSVPITSASRRTARQDTRGRPGPDHGEDTQDKAGDGGGTRPGAELPEKQADRNEPSTNPIISGLKY